MLVLIVGAFIAGRLSPPELRPTSGRRRPATESGARADPARRPRRTPRSVAACARRAGERGWRRAATVAGERDRAEQLVSANRLYRQTAAADRRRVGRRLLDQLERVLVEVAASPDRIPSSRAWTTSGGGSSRAACCSRCVWCLRNSRSGGRPRCGRRASVRRCEFIQRNRFMTTAFAMTMVAATLAAGPALAPVAGRFERGCRGARRSRRCARQPRTLAAVRPGCGARPGGTRPRRVTRRRSSADRSGAAGSRGGAQGPRARPGGRRCSTRPTAMDSDRWDRAVDAFDRVAAMKGTRADAALYWKAYSQDRLGQRAEALATIAELTQDLPEEPLPEAGAGARDGGAAQRRAAGQPRAQSDEDLKLMALNALLNSDPEKAIPMLEKLLQGPTSPKLRDRALFVLAQSNSPRARADPEEPRARRLDAGAPEQGDPVPRRDGRRREPRHARRGLRRHHRRRRQAADPARLHGLRRKAAAAGGGADRTEPGTARAKPSSSSA